MEGEHNRMAKAEEKSKIEVEKVRTALSNIWSVKYVPKKLEELACTDEIRDFLANCIKKKEFPNHLCFFGKPGTGKNSIVSIIRHNFDAHVLVINASEENGIDDIRGKVLSFCNSGALINKPKIVVMNEADGLTQAAQNSMRELMEVKADFVRFIFTCNYIGQIIAPLQSRCLVLKIDPPAKEIVRRLMEVLRLEGVEFDKEFIKSMVKVNGRDLRKILNEAQVLSTTHDKLSADIIEENEYSDEGYIEFFDELFGMKDLKAIGEKVKDQMFDEEVYTCLADYCMEKNFPAETIPIIADHLYRSHLIFDKDLVFMSCILTLKPIITKKK